MEKILLKINDIKTKRSVKAQKKELSKRAVAKKEAERKETIESLLPFEQFYGDILSLKRNMFAGSCTAAFKVDSVEVNNATDEIISNLLNDFETLLDKSFYVTQICQYNFRATESSYIDHKKHILENTTSTLAYEWISSDLEFDEEVLHERYSFQADYIFVIRFDYLPTSNLNEDLKRAKRKFDLFLSSSNNLFRKHNVQLKQLNKNEYSELLYYVLNPDMKGKQIPVFDEPVVKGFSKNKRPINKNSLFSVEQVDEFELDDTEGTDIIQQSQYSLKNKIVPYTIKKLDDCLLVGDMYTVTYEVYNLPTYIKTFWQKELSSHVGNIDISYFFKCLKTDEIVKELERIDAFSRANLTDNKGQDMTYKSNTKNMKKQSDNIAATFDQIQDGQRLFNFSMYVRVRAKSYEQLLSECEDVENILGSTLCNFRKTVDNYVNGLISMLPLATDELETTIPMLTQGVGNTFPMTNHSYSIPNGQFFGINKSNETIFKFANQTEALDNGIVLVTGKSGSGKSVTSKKIVKNNYFYYNHRIFGIDPDNECIEVCKSLNGQYINIYSGSPERINIFEPFDDPEMDSIIQTVVNSSSVFVSSALKLNEDENFQLKYLINELLRKFGFTDDKKSLYIESETDGQTFNLEENVFRKKRTAPTMSDLYQLANEDSYEEYIESTKLLASKIKLLTNGGVFPIFDGQTNIDLTSRVIFFGFKRCDKEYKNVSIGVAYDLYWKLKLLYIDEDMSVYNEEFSYVIRDDSIGEYAFDIAIRSRKFKGFPVFTTQNISVVVNSKWGEAILTNAATCIFMKQSQKDAKEIVSLMDALKPAHISKMVQMDKGECVIVINETKVVNVQVIVSEREMEYFKTS